MTATSPPIRSTNVENQPSRRGLVRAAGVIGLGNIASRLLGLVRETVIANRFGAGALVDSFSIAATVPTIVNDMLIGGLLSSALVPVFSEYAERDEAEFWRLGSAVLSVATALLAAISLVLMLAAPLVVRVMASGFTDAAQQALTVTLVRLVVPATFFTGVSGIFIGLLYALKRFTFPAFAAAIYNLGIIIGAVLISQLFDGEARIYGLAIGVLLGSTGQFFLLMPDLRGAPLRLTRAWRHPGLRRIVALYIPIALSVVVANISVVIDRNLATTTGVGSLSWMRYATTLQQLPLGLIAVAVSQAVLPSLARLTAPEQAPDFRHTLQQGLRLVTVLMVPAAVGLFVLAEPIVALLFEHGDFSPTDTLATAAALRLYLLGMVFAAIDQPLIFAFYARQDTWTPSLVGVLGVGVYLLVALPLVRPLGYLGLVLASSMQLAAHALIMLLLLQWRLRGLDVGDLLDVGLRATGAALLMGLAVWGVLALTQGDALTALASLPPLLREGLGVALPAVVGVAVYAIATLALRVDEAHAAIGVARRKLRL